MRKDKRQSEDVVYVVWRISQFCASQTIPDVTN